MQIDRWGRWLGIVGLVTVLAACAQPAGQNGTGGTTAAQKPAGPKNLTIGIQRGLPQRVQAHAVAVVEADGERVEVHV